MRRFASLWLPHWPTDRWRWRRAEPPAEPLVLFGRGRRGLAVTAVDATAAAAGLAPGMTLADARAVVPELVAVDADAQADAASLDRLAGWCGRYTPWTATNGADGVIMDITGCAHLFGGEEALLSDLLDRLSGFGLTARAAIADASAAAWAWARYGGGGVVAQGGTQAALASLPVAALRLSAETVAALHRVGLRRIGDLEDLPRAPLAARFGARVPERLDQAFGRAAEPISPRRPPAPWRCRLTFPEPVGRREDLDEAARRLIGRLTARLEREEQGARRLWLTFYRVDGGFQRLAVGTSRPARDPRHLARLFAEPLGTTDPGFGVETMMLEATSEPLGARQLALGHEVSGTGDDLARLVDRLQNRLGRGSVVE
ncbi:MAG TPA: DNA polymerase Y family protein, partial [Alphaproteobacteria bacterium]|nr:DNA polymerase Y family protein [Alphaproteobacteria bacterium]